MRKFCLMTVMMCVGLISTSANLLSSIATVESSNNSKAVGDSGKALGIYQLHAEYVADVNRIYKTNYKHEDAFDAKIAKGIVAKYLAHYGKQYEKTVGKPATAEVLARIHNGGPNGWKKDATIKYWCKVEKIYK